MGRDHGIAPALLLGDRFRAAGSDAVIYPEVGGRFTFSERTCVAINARLRGPLGPVRPAFPVPADSIDAAVLRFRDYRWDTVPLREYKPGDVPYKDVTRQTLLGEAPGEEPFTGEEPLGFLCTADRVRDRPEVVT